MDRYFVQLDKAGVPFVYVNDFNLLKKPGVFEVNRAEADRCLILYVERRPHPSYMPAAQPAYLPKQLITLPDFVRPGEPGPLAIPVPPVVANDDIIASAPEADNAVVAEVAATAAAAPTAEGDVTVLDQDSIFLQEVDKINAMAKAPEIEEYMLKKYRVEVDGRGKGGFANAAKQALKGLRKEGKLFISN